MAIYRGPGGPGDATADSANTAQLAEEFALDAANSATAAANSATSASNSAIAAETSETNAGVSATNAAASASAASTSATNASNSATSAAFSASAAAASETAAAASETNAASSVLAASTSESNAASSASAAATSATNAAASASTASTAATNAGNSETAAAASAFAAATSESNAASSASSASTSATNASNSATAASSSASAAAASESAAAASEIAAAASETAAAASETAAAASESAAATSETNAAASEAAAATSETNAAASESAAAASAAASLTSETNAASSASAASTSASNASTSETNAAASASAAATSESNAATSASNAATSESNAATSETNASNSASAAATSASNAATSETNAAASASAALTSETNAASSASAAATSETNAANSATAAAGSASAALTSETNAATSASNAATSETNASNSASAASTSASNAATSESNAATSASNAATSASNAATSETNAAASESAALAAQAAAESVYDDFDDRYLGDKASDPSLDNDGNALLTGALYWNTTDNELKVYTGSVWSSLGAGGNPFDQNLNTTDSPTFAGLTLSGKFTVGTFPNSTTNSGEAWVGRAADRPTGTLTVQLGGGAGRKFEVVDSGWTTVEFSADDSGIATAAGSFRSPIFYDSNNTGYYLDPNSTTSLRTVGSWRADSSSWDGEFSGKIQYHSNHWYLQAAGNWLFRNSGGANVFDVNQSGTAIAVGDMRAPIFYDYNDTGYYADPNSTSSFSSLNLGGNVSSGAPYNNATGEPLRFGGYSSDGYSIGTTLENVGGNYTKLNLRWHTGIRIGAQVSYGGVRFYTNEDFSSTVMQINGGSNYIYKYTWMYTNTTGYYSDTNGAHFYPNNVTYGSWRIAGSRNGWYGIHFDSNMTLMMNDNACGVHREGSGWRFYVESTNLYCNGQIQAYWSDRRLKENFRPIESESLDILSKMTAYRFNWNKKVKELNLDIEVGKEEISLIAQDVQAILPDAVAVNKAGAKPNGEKFDYLTINYDRITPIVVQAINELRQQFEGLSAEVDAIKEKVYGAH